MHARGHYKGEGWCLRTLQKAGMVWKEGSTGLQEVGMLQKEVWFGVMYDHTFLNLKIARSDISPHIKWAVSLVFAYGHFNVPLGCEWVYMN